MPEAAPSLKEAAAKLVKKIEAIHSSPEYQAIWTMAAVHGRRYRGEDYDKELQDLKKALVLEAVFAPL